jgi:hypothetical protein
MPKTPNAPDMPAHPTPESLAGRGGAAPADLAAPGTPAPDPGALRPPRHLKDAFDKMPSAKPATPALGNPQPRLEDLLNHTAAPAETAETGTEASKFLDGLKEALADSAKP